MNQPRTDHPYGSSLSECSATPSRVETTLINGFSLSPNIITNSHLLAGLLAIFQT
jgi:hypothetical protein